MPLAILKHRQGALGAKVQFYEMCDSSTLVQINLEKYLGRNQYCRDVCIGAAGICLSGKFIFC